MAGGLIGALRVTLGIDTAAFESGSKRARARASSDAKAIALSYENMTGALEKAFGGLAAGITIGAITAAAERALDYASSLAEVAQQLGVTSKNLQEYRYAASQVGISQEEMDKGLAKLTVTMGKAREGVKEPVAAFRELSGILGKDILKNAATAGDAIPLIAAALAKVQDPARRAAIEVALFGKTGQLLDTLLSTGAGGVNNLRDAAQSLGLVLSEKQIADADNTADKLSELKQVLEANIAGAVSNNATAILALANALEQLAVHAGQAAQAYGDWKNLQGYKSGDISSGIALGQTKSGRATMINYLDEQLAQNSRQRAEPLLGSNPIVAKTLDDEFKRLTKQRNAAVHLDRSAERVATAVPKPASPGLSPGASGGGGARTPRGSGRRSGESDAAKQQKKAEEQRKRYDQELAGMESDQLRLTEDLTTNLSDRADLENRRIDAETDAYKKELDSKVTLGELTGAQAAKLLAAKKYNADLQHDAVNQQMDDDLIRQSLATEDARLQLQADLLRGELDEAKTQTDRRTIQLKLLDIEYARQRIGLESVEQLHASSPKEKDTASKRLKQLDVLEKHDAQPITRDTAGPMEAFGDSLHRTAGQIQEDFEQIEVDGIKSLNDGLVDAIVNSKNLGDVFQSVAKQILADLIKIGIQAAESLIFKGSSSSGGSDSSGSSGGLGGLLSGILSIFGGGGGGNFDGDSVSAGVNAALDGLGAHAAGGIFKVAGNSGLDTNLLSINGMPAARVNHGETIAITPANQSRMGGDVHLHMANDFRGADAMAVAGINAKLDKMQRELPATIYGTVQDLGARNLLRGTAR